APFSQPARFHSLARRPRATVPRHRPCRTRRTRSPPPIRLRGKNGRPNRPPSQDRLPFGLRGLRALRANAVVLCRLVLAGAGLVPMAVALTGALHVHLLRSHCAATVRLLMAMGNLLRAQIGGRLAVINWRARGTPRLSRSRLAYALGIGGAKR